MERLSAVATMARLDRRSQADMDEILREEMGGATLAEAQRRLAARIRDGLA